MPGRTKNLLRNPCAEDGLDHWEVVNSGGNGFQCEEKPIGCKMICKRTRVKGSGIGHKFLPCWSTSYGICEKFQLVYLPEFDISEKKLDQKKPPIEIRDWYGARFDCGCKYKISVRLLADDKSTELDAWYFSDTKEKGSDWTKVKHVFEDYPSGVRYVEFKHGGQNTRYLAGFFGVKMTNSGVFVGKKRNYWKKRDVREKSGKNLVKNPCGTSGLAGWKIISNGGDGFKCEKRPEGCKPLTKANPNAEGESCWCTSYQVCEKKQLIDLRCEGFDPHFMDEFQPEIKISEWFGSREDAGCNYWLKVRLLNADMEEIDNRTIQETKDAEGDWYKVEESFTGYGSGVRFIEYVHGGHDTRYWAGYFGAKITCSYVAVVAENLSSSSSSSSSDENCVTSE